MKRPPEEEGRRWLEQARKDLSAAEVLSEHGHHNVACFLAQQAAEKAVKAFLYSHGAEHVWGHSVAELLKDSSTFADIPNTMVAKGFTLDKHYIATRYPNGLPGGIPADAYSADDAQAACDAAADIIDGMPRLLD
jgi:HEPN domain-containing protein